MHWTQKLKEKNLQLRRDIRELVHNPTSMKSEEIKMAVRMDKSFEDAAMYGERKTEKK